MITICRIASKLIVIVPGFESVGGLSGKGRRSVLIGKVGVVRLLMNCARGYKE